ncbi:hypothetical protein AQUCO_00200993v1 [Aquilegia coerulea]|uniref:Uncharacterized protein n=1 Tax=Aquilegia coerulea TaxID=218851 RepID=A0A2G5F5R5_AQUCA|nr:hypothetical protein AQUCO_00200993v1 [Aquilegia coerulea]
MMASTSIPSSSSGSKIPLSSTIPNKPTSQQQQQQGCVVIKDDVEMSEKMVGDDNQLEAEDRGKLDMGENFFEDTETAQKFEKYQADYARYLRAKYFSGKNLYGGNNSFDLVIIATSYCYAGYSESIEYVQLHSPYVQ